jgi:hypothetical protein
MAWEINLPQTPSQWRHTSPNVHLRELGGWNSASQIQKSHYLAAKIIWRFRNVSQMNRPEFRAVTTLSDEADQHSRKYLKAFNDWKLYRTDIRSKGPNRPEPGHATWLGSFSYTRDQQLAILDRVPIDTAMASPTEMSEAEEAMSETESEYSEAMKESTLSLTSSASLRRVITAHSEHSATDPKTAIPSSGEDFVNVAAVSFLTTLTMGCKLAKLEWEVYKHRFDVQLGEASIRAITDGRLCSRSRTDIHAIVEVKPFVLTQNADNPIDANGHRDVGLDQ